MIFLLHWPHCPCRLHQLSLLVLEMCLLELSCSAGAVHRFLCVEYGNSTEHLFRPQDFLFPVTSVCCHLCIRVTLQRHQGEIVNYLHQVHFTGLSTREILGNVCQAQCRAECSSPQSSVSNGSRSLSSLRQEVGQML